MVQCLGKVAGSLQSSAEKGQLRAGVEIKLEVLVKRTTS